MASAAEQLAANLNFGALAKSEDLKKRIWFTLGALIVYRLGSYIPIPGVDAIQLAKFAAQNSNGILGWVNNLAGGALGRMAIFALNIMPYISASIIIQLMSSVSPQLEALKKEGEQGRKKINQYTRYGTVFLAALQSYGIAVGLEGQGGLVVDPGMFFRISTVITLTGGTVFLMWLGEQITSRGIGNGISLIIYAGIVANLPQAVIGTFELGRQGALSAVVILGVLVLVAAVIGYVVFMERAQRKILIQYPKRQVAVNMPAVAQTTHLPLKLNSAGVIPPIFASSILMFPSAIAQFMGGGDGFFLSSLTRGSWLYLVLFSGLILFFSFFYSSIIFNTTDVANNLKKSNCFILGIRPGVNTSSYLDKIIARLTLLGAIYLIIICIIPEILITKYSVPLHIGGTGALIIVNVVLDLIVQVQSHSFSSKYSSNVKRKRVRMRGSR